MKLNKKQMARAKEQAKPQSRQSYRTPNYTAPVSEVKFSFYAEQKLYDRMYEAEVWKNGRFFGYRSQVNSRWHDDEQSNRVAEVMSDQYDQKRFPAALTIKMEEQLELQEEHADWLHRQDELAEAKEQHKRKTRG